MKFVNFVVAVPSTLYITFTRCSRLRVGSLTAMVTLTVSSASKPPAFARGFPLSIEVSDDATVADVKASIATKYPKVSI